MSFKRNNTILKSTLSQEGVLRLTLNNPNNHNVLSEEMMENIQLSLDQATKDKKTRVIIISAEGSTFSAGHDLKELKSARKNSDKGKDYFNNIMLKCSKMMQSIVKNPKPIIAEVSGVANLAEGPA